MQQRGGSGPQETTLVSDFLLVEVKGEGWLPFRDVFERDGKAVRDREERLAAIFLKGGRNAFEQARAVMDEGARYNIGNINRNINTPTLAAGVPHRASSPSLRVQARQARRIRILASKSSSARRLVPRSSRRPAVATFPFADVSGYATPTAPSFAPSSTPLDTGVEAHITVTYQKDESIGLFAPARMEERYRRPRDPMEVQGVATYSRFRRFQVSTSEELAQVGP